MRYIGAWRRSYFGLFKRRNSLATRIGQGTDLSKLTNVVILTGEAGGEPEVDEVTLELALSLSIALRDKVVCLHMIFPIGVFECPDREIHDVQRLSRLETSESNSLIIRPRDDDGGQKRHRRSG
ncbi:hypothetical protein H109_06582 [Trichophyton interdigitale MR816]|uniref:Uncharacterized protein n=1 Tax=Trichophyton interdigitale (strain MR816) TaxID=1215338 RepID=A0A059J1B7_TRIIM|nr:hypothetical protein H109_06582 [Trichophyton interdigitale MR816]